MARDKAPSLMGLTLNVGLAGLALGIERIELKVEVNHRANVSRSR
jgi:hypothetical protein